MITPDSNSKALVFVFGDQLTPQISSLQECDPTSSIVLMAEVMEEATYVRHHKKKLALVFAAMRHFASELRDLGWTVDYVRLDSDDNRGSLSGEIDRAIERHQPDRIIMTEPAEWRPLQAMRDYAKSSELTVSILPDTRFITSHEEFQAWAEGRKQLRMEYFYRDMRRKTGLLMDGDKPVGGQWNFDAENRKPADIDLFMPKPLHFESDPVTEEALDLVEARFGHHFGDLRPFWFGVTRQHAQAALDHFISSALPQFGDYQDAMLEDEDFLYHSVLSHYINLGLLDALQVCQRVEDEYRAGRVPLNSAEGFIRQIIGWREYVRGIYWLKMPDYVGLNFLEADRPLPEFYWSGETDMACLSAAIGQTKRQAYAHHIQRLMVTGNFAMLIGADPAEVHEWYLAVYADAYEWVELPNTLGMSQFGDGGLLGSKPYASSGNYINKMSNYCQNCSFDVKQKTGPNACPFNSLYWDFLARNADKLGTNPRLRQVYNTWSRIAPEKQQAYRESAAEFLATLT